LERKDNLMNTDKQKQYSGLKPFKPGQSGNPKGRPKKSDCLIDCINKELSSKSVNGVSTREQIIASALVGMAEKGNLKAIEILMTYTTIKPVQAHEITGANGGPVQLQWIEDGNDK
jgi:hypothetical protein